MDMDLYQAIEKAGEWWHFEQQYNLWNCKIADGSSFASWLFCLSGEGYEDRCKMVAEFYGWEGKCL